MSHAADTTQKTGPKSQADTEAHAGVNAGVNAGAETEPAAGRQTPARATPPLAPVHVGVADFMHGPLVQTIVMADRKAGILFTLVSAALLFLFTRMPVPLWSGRGAAWGAVVGLLVAAAVCAFLVIFPRIRRRDNVYFWASVAGHADADAFVATVAEEAPDDLARAKLVYCYDLACICRRKFRLLKIAMLATAAGLLLFLAFTALALPLARGGVPTVM